MIKKILSPKTKYLFKSILNGILILQLSLLPGIGQANQTPNQTPSQTQASLPEGTMAENTTPEEAIALSPNDQNRLERAKKFNTEHVKNLREYFFSNQDNKVGNYKQHPLDIFALIGQSPSYQSNSLLKKGTALEESKKELEKLKQEIQALDETQEDKKYELIEQLEKLQQKIALQSEKLAQRQNRHQLNNKINYKNVLVEIVEDSDQTDKSKEKVVSLLAHPERQALSSQILNNTHLAPPTTSFIKSDEGKKSFRLSFHGRTIQTFPQNIEWMSFFENYLLFLEAPKVKETTALLSFIDLQFFERAIGHTALPVFQIPIDFQTVGLSAEELLSPKITISGRKPNTADIVNTYQALPEYILNIGKIALSHSQLDYLSGLQQMTFNASVALLDPASVQSSQEFLKQWALSLTESLKPLNALDSTTQQIADNTKQQLLKVLENRRQIGTPQDISGNYGTLNSLALKLPKDSKLSKEEQKISQEFKEALQADKGFLAGLAQSHQNITAEQNFLNRYFFLLSTLTRPQPLGAPKLKTALALLANSVSLKGDTLENRFQAFAEAFKQMLYPKPVKRFGIPVLVGLSAVASPEVARFYGSAINGMAGWTQQWLELVSVTASTSFEWVKLDGIYQSYFEGDKKFNLLKGVVALSGAFLVSLGILHLGINATDYKKALRLDKEKQHRKKANSLFAKFKQRIPHFINYIEQGRKDFIQNLSQGERAKLGIPSQISFGLNNIQSQQSLKTASGWTDLLSALKKDKLLLQFHIPDMIIELQKVPHTTNLTEKQVAISIEGTETVFEGKRADIKLLLETQADTIEFEMSGDKLHISGMFSQADFSTQENTRLNAILAEIEKERGKDILTTKQSDLTNAEITTLKQALVHLSLGYSSWAKTVRFLGLSWNWWFLSRSIVIAPVTIVKILWYSKYFNIVFTKAHRPTVFNGGEENRFTRMVSRAFDSKGFIKIKEFEEQVIALEKEVLTRVNEQAYLESLNLAIARDNARDISQKDLSQILSSSDKSLDPKDIKNKKLRIFYSIYQGELFTKLMRDILGETDLLVIKSNPLRTVDPPSSASIKYNSLQRFAETNTFPKFDPDFTQELIKFYSETVRQESLKATNNLISGFLKRRTVLLEQKTQKVLNPSYNLQMQRFSMAQQLLNKPEALARASRQFLTNIVVDKPIELLFLFLFFAGVDQGILQILHDKAFTEEAWFHLSRYAVWAGFFGMTMIEILGSTWLKVQMDARLDATGGFNNIPNKKQAQASYLRWLYKQFKAPDNNWWENQKYSLTIAWSNLVASTVTLTALWALTLGRFDLELWLAGYLIYFVTPLMGLSFQIENSFEKSANYSLKPLIDKGLDLKDKDQKFLAHPSVQAIHINESSKLRRKFNLWLAVLYNNPVGNMLDIFQSVDTTAGSRGLLRLFGGQLPTEHFVSFMDFLESKNIVGSGFSESCKSIFTNNRTDL